MKNKRNITPLVPEVKRRNVALRLAGSLVSDRLGAQGFAEPLEDRNAELPLGAPTRAADKGEGSPDRN